MHSIPIYEAIEIISVIPEKVGHTKPWVVLAKTPEGLMPFVVKLYDTNQADIHHCVTKEFICNILSKEFDLNAPKCAFIDIPNHLIVNRSTEEQQQYDNADPRFKFSTMQLESVSNAILGLPKKEYQKRIKMDTLYAFDNLVRNSDRGKPKINLLLSSNSNEVFLIDHELSLAEQDITNFDFNSLQFEDRFTKNHLFYSYLKKTRKDKKLLFFEEFSFYLNDLNLSKLTPYFNQLKQEGFIDYSFHIHTWLEQVKQNNNIFVNHLKGSIL